MIFKKANKSSEGSKNAPILEGGGMAQKAAKNSCWRLLDVCVFSAGAWEDSLCSVSVDFRGQQGKGRVLRGHQWV